MYYCEIKRATCVYSNLCWCLQFILNLQTNIRAKVYAIVNIKIDMVTASTASVLVSNTATFTDANNDAALAGQKALMDVYASDDLSGIFGTEYGNVTVSDVSPVTAANPSKSYHAFPVTCNIAAVFVAYLNVCIGFCNLLLQQFQHLLTLSRKACVSRRHDRSLCTQRQPGSDSVMFVCSTCQWSWKGQRRYMYFDCSFDGSHHSSCPVIEGRPYC